MKRTEKTIDLRQSYNKIIAQMQNDNYLLPPEWLQNEEFFFHILQQEDATILATFFKAAQNNGVSIKQIIEEEKYKTLKLAVKNQNHQVMKLLLDYVNKEGVELQAVLQDVEHMLFIYAVQNENHEVMELLLEQGSNAGINIQKALKSWDYLLFQYAAQNANHEVIKLLLKKGSDVGIDIQEALKTEEYTAFRDAAKNKNHKVMELLLEKGSDVGIDIKKVLEAKSCLTFRDAAKNENHKVMELLLERVSNVEIDIITALKSWTGPLFQYAAHNANHEVIKLLLEKGSDIGIDIKKVLESGSYTIFHYAAGNKNPEVMKLLLSWYSRERNIDISEVLKIDDLLHQVANANHAVLDVLVKTLAELENGNKTIITLIHNYPTLFNKPEKLVLALSYIKTENKESFAKYVLDILNGIDLTKTSQDYINPNAIMSSAYKISVLRQEVGDSLFSNKGNFDNKWLKSGKLTKLSLVTRDLMKYVPIKDEHNNSLDGTNKVTTFSSLSKNLKATVLSFLIAPKESKPESISAILTVLRQSLHNALEEQEIKAGTYNKPLALLRKEVIITNTSNNLASKEVAMPKVYEEQRLYAKDDTNTNNLISLNVPALEAPYEQSEQLKELISLRKEMYEKASTVERSKQDREPPAAPPSLNGEAEASNSLQPKTVALSDASQEQNISAINSEAEFAEQNTAYVPSSLPKTLYNVAVGLKVLDTAIDTTRLLYEPTGDNARKVIMDSTHLYSAFYGWNWPSVFVTVADGIYSGSIGEYDKVLQNAGMTAAYMGLSYVANKGFLYAAASVGVPQLALGYSAVTALYGAYSLLSNSYSFYEEYSSGDLALKSGAAYAERGWQNDLYQFDNDLHVEL